MKKILMLLCLVSLFLFPCMANAEEKIIENVGEEIVVPENPNQPIIDELLEVLKESGVIVDNTLEYKVFDYIITAVVGFIGTLLVLLAYKKKADSVGSVAKGLIGNASVSVDDLKKKIDVAFEQITEATKMLGVETEGLIKFKNQMILNVNNLQKSITQTIKNLNEQYLEIKDSNDKLLACLKIFLLNNPDLVQSGLVEEIKKVLANVEKS